MEIGIEDLMSTERTYFGVLLRRYRMAAGLTQEALADLAKLSVRTIADLERGINRVPRHETLELLIEALQLSPQQRTLILSSVRPEIAAPATWIGRMSSLPLPPTALVGRVHEMVRVMTYLQQDGIRLLTLTGTSGVGKTRLGIELAHKLVESFEDGVVFVELAPFRDPMRFTNVLAQALGLCESPLSSAGEQVQTYLHDKHLLLILDNFEQIREAAPEVASLLVTCARLQVLITSRAPLHLRGEQEFAITPLTLDAAVALFMARAQSVQPERDYETSVVAAICKQVDCLPLAIELVARHIKVLTLPLLLERLTTRLPLLRDGARDLPERQQAMQSSIAWSYGLLTTSQQRCFRALGVFASDWTLAAAEVVCRLQGVLSGGEVLDRLSALIDASLLSVENSVPENTRFSMLAILREYALDRLREAGEEELTRRQHAQYYAEWAEAAVSLAPRQERHQVELVSEFPNARVALHWTLEHQELELGFRLAIHFGRLWFVHGQMREGSIWLEQILTLDAEAGEQTAPRSLRIAALSSAARLAMSQGHQGRATTLAEEALHLAERSADHAGLSQALAMLDARLPQLR